MKRAAGVLVGLVLACWVWNSSWLVSGTEDHQTRLIAHRGVHQIYAGNDRSSDACHAAPVQPITHEFVENTLPSMREAFRLGADVVELDVHLTTDNAFAVFHDWTLECRTNGNGVTHKHDLAALKALDAGYRIDDGTETYPLRGKGAEIPTLAEVFEAEPEGAFLINFKSRRKEDGEALAEMLSQVGLQQVYGVYGGAPPTKAALLAKPQVRGFTRNQIKSCLVRYLTLGWSGYVPKDCRSTAVMVPKNFAPFLWGWPHRFTQRLRAAGTDVILVGDYDGSGFSSGIDDRASFEKVPTQFDGFVWTNAIERIGPLNTQRVSTTQ